MEILHLADVHLKRGPSLKPTFKALEVAAEHAKAHKVKMIALTGDYFDASARLEQEVAHLAQQGAILLAEAAPLLIVRGTPTHDIPGSLDHLGRLRAKHQIYVSNQPELLGLYGNRIAPLCDQRPDQVISAIQEMTIPTLRTFAEGESESDLVMNFRKFMLAMITRGAMAAEHHGVPFLTAAHGPTHSAVSPAGYRFDGSALCFHLDDFRQADYAALGHIHKPQRLAVNIAYSGSLYPQDHSESGQHGVILAEVIRGREPDLEWLPVPHTPVLTVDLGKQDIEQLDPETITGTDIKIKIQLREGESSAEQEKAITESLLSMGAVNVKFERRIETTIDDKVEGVSRQKDNLGKLLLWSQVHSVKLPEGIHADLYLLESCDDPNEIVRKVMDEVDGVHQQESPQSAGDNVLDDLFPDLPLAVNS
jgi:exonuclease SbcD